MQEKTSEFHKSIKSRLVVQQVGEACLTLCGCFDQFCVFVHTHFSFFVL